MKSAGNSPTCSPTGARAGVRVHVLLGLGGQREVGPLVALGGDEKSGRRGRKIQASPLVSPLAIQQPYAPQDSRRGRQNRLHRRRRHRGSLVGYWRKTPSIGGIRTFGWKARQSLTSKPPFSTIGSRRYSDVLNHDSYFPELSPPARLMPRFSKARPARAATACG